MLDTINCIYCFGLSTEVWGLLKMKSAGKYDELRTIINNRQPMVRWYRRRYRDRICCLSPEAWLAISFTLFVLGLGLLNAGTYVLDGSENEKDREIVYKIGSFLMFFGWAAFVFLIDRVKSRNGQRQIFIRDNTIPFVGVSISPPLHQEWISDMLLPEFERGWIEIESEQGFEPNFFENLDQLPTPATVPPPTPATVEEDGDDNDTRLSASKKKRNRKKKTNNQVTESDRTERYAEILGQIEVFGEVITAEQPVELCREDRQPQSSGEIDSSKNASDGDTTLEESVKVGGHQSDSRRTPGARDYNQTSVEDRNACQTSEQSEGLHQTSGQSKESQKTSGQQTNAHKTSEEIRPENLNRTSAKTPISNQISSGNNPEICNQNALGNKSKQSNETSTKFKDSNQIYSDNPEQSHQIFDHSHEPNADGMKPVVSNLESNLNSQQPTSKKKNRRRKK